MCLLVFLLPVTKAGAEVCVWFSFFLWLVKKALGERSAPDGGILPETGLNKVLGIFILVNVLSAVFSVHHASSWRAIFGKELKFMAVFFMTAEVINTKSRLRTVLAAFVASALLLVVDAGFQYFTGRDFVHSYPFWGDARLCASFSNPNGFAGWLVVLILLLWSLLAPGVSLGKTAKIFLSVLILSLSACLVLTYSRGGWLGLAVGIALAAWFWMKGAPLKTRYLCGASVVCLLVVYAVLPLSVKDRIETRTHAWRLVNNTLDELRAFASKEKATNSVRVNLMRQSLAVIKDYPLLGTGVNTYSKIIPRYRIFQFGDMYAHNSFLQMTIETGLLGLVSFLVVVGVFFRKGLRHLAWKKSPLVLGLISAISAFLVHAFFDNHLYALQLVVLFWFLLGLTVAVIRIESEARR